MKQWMLDVQHWMNSRFTLLEWFVIMVVWFFLVNCLIGWFNNGLS